MQSFLTFIKRVLYIENSPRLIEEYLVNGAERVAAKDRLLLVTSFSAAFTSVLYFGYLSEELRWGLETKKDSIRIFAEDEWGRGYLVDWFEDLYVSDKAVRKFAEEAVIQLNDYRQNDVDTQLEKNKELFWDLDNKQTAFNAYEKSFKIDFYHQIQKFDLIVESGIKGQSEIIPNPRRSVMVLGDTYERFWTVRVNFFRKLSGSGAEPVEDLFTAELKIIRVMNDVSPERVKLFSYEEL